MIVVKASVFGKDSLWLASLMVHEMGHMREGLGERNRYKEQVQFLCERLLAGDTAEFERLQWNWVRDEFTRSLAGSYKKRFGRSLPWRSDFDPSKAESWEKECYCYAKEHNLLWKLGFE
jgi:hypothetical protein